MWFEFRFNICLVHWFSYIYSRSKGGIIFLDSIINFFQWISDLIQIVIDFVINIFTSLIEFISILPTIVTFVFGSIGYLPSSVTIFATISITVAITLLILGRSNNG